MSTGTVPAESEKQFLANMYCLHTLHLGSTSMLNVHYLVSGHPNPAGSVLPPFSHQEAEAWLSDSVTQTPRPKQRYFY